MQETLPTLQLGSTTDAVVLLAEIWERVALPCRQGRERTFSGIVLGAFQLLTAIEDVEFPLWLLLA